MSLEKEKFSICCCFLNILIDHPPTTKFHNFCNVFFPNRLSFAFLFVTFGLNEMTSVEGGWGLEWLKC